MAPQNDFLPFCPTDTGTNLLSESDYLAAAGRTSGNQPGIASAKLNNKALRQATYVTSQMAQFLSSQLGEDVLDDATPTKLLAQFFAALKPYAPKIQTMLTGTGTYNPTYIFQIASGNATAAATYTNNGKTFTVVTTVATGTEIFMTGTGDPTLGGTLTKASGTGDATLTFYAFRKPIIVNIELAGGGGGGGGSGTGSPGNGGTGGSTTFGTTLLVATGGLGGGGGSDGGTGGTGSLGSGPTGLPLSGGGGTGNGIANTTPNTANAGGNGGVNPFGGGGGGGLAAVNARSESNAIDNTGGGGGGAGSGSTATNASGGGGGAGGYVNAWIANPTGSYAWAVGAGGSAGTNGTAGFSAGTGGKGVIVVMEIFQ